MRKMTLSPSHNPVHPPVNHSVLQSLNDFHFSGTVAMVTTHPTLKRCVPSGLRRAVTKDKQRTREQPVERDSRRMSHKATHSNGHLYNEA